MNPTGMRADGDPVLAAAGRGPGSDSEPTGGLVEGPLVPGGPTYLSAFRTTQTPPLVVAVSLDRDEVLANARRQTRILAVLSLGIAATMIATLAALFRQMDAKFRAEQEARLISEEAGRLKEEFLMTVSHELRTPLQSILGWAHVLLAGGRSEETTNTALQSIERNVGLQTRLIDDLLDVSRAVSGRLHIELKTVDVAEIVGHVVDNSRPAATAKSIQFRFTAAPAPPMAADPDRLQQIVWNLVSNAIKFTPEDGRVDVRVGSDDGHIDIVVADSGIGIEPEFLPHVFERFRQADGGTTRRYGGLGLGLAIVRHLTELHGGVVSAESAGVDRGATFRVRFPTTEAQRH
jgi:signal transduction histidine kinase